MPYGSTIVITKITPYAGYSLKEVTFRYSDDKIVTLEAVNGTYSVTVVDSGSLWIYMKSNTYSITYNYDGGSVSTANTATYDEPSIHFSPDSFVGSNIVEFPTISVSFSRYQPVNL